jgi:DNA helicase-2/ATP-dependent DNA helicase PcrA
VLGTIGKAKNELIGAEDYVPPSYWHEAVKRAYRRYQELLAANDAADFDDLLMLTVRLFRENPDILERYQNHYLYLHVDEFQDTNVAQYVLMKLLADKYQNLFCVGDEDQSIYGWRGADFRNVLRFREDFPNARIKLLEQNYRSTQTIVDVAQAVITKNQTRHVKNLWTENPRGIPIAVFEAYNEEEEAQFVVNEIARLTKEKHRPRDFAVFYRTNAQSRVIEDQFVRRGMPYKLVGATRFYQRREVKDLLAYLRLLSNPNDSVSLNRVLNVPPRGIGKRTMDELALWSQRLHTPPFAVLEMMRATGKAAQVKDGGHELPLPTDAFDARARRVLGAFANLIDEWTAQREGKTLVELFDWILGQTRFEDYIRDGTPEGDDRWENVVELRKVTMKYSSLPTDIALTQFLEEVALVQDVDTLDENIDAPTLMTLHTAKGLEFPVVFIAGLEEGLFPHSRSFEDPAQMEEERRLFYVGITRAKERLYLLHAFRRSMYGNSEPGDASRFLADIPTKLLTPESRGSHVDTRPLSRRHTETWGDDDGEGKLEDPRKPRSETPKQTISASQPSSALRPPAPPTEFKAGDRVQHPSFGTGVVISSKISGTDEEVQVAFEGLGVKRLIVQFAGLTKKS